MFDLTRPVLAVAAAATLIAGCGDDPAPAEDAAAVTGSTAETSSSDTDVDVDADADPGSAEVQFQGTTYQMTADEPLGCFLTADGGSQGGVSFEGDDGQGNRLSVDWAGDTPEAAVANLELADGGEWTTPFTETNFDVTLTPPSAVIVTTLVSLTDGSQADLVFRPTCP